MNNIIVFVVLSMVTLSALLVVYLKKVPHGWIQLRSGLVLKFLPHLDSKPVIELRGAIEGITKKTFPRVKRTLPVRIIRDVFIPTRHGHVPARIFDESTNASDHVIVFIHGGGWCVGSVNVYEEQCRRIALTTKLPVLSLDYSLAPEHKFPRAHEECVDAVEWISKNSGQIDLPQLPLILIGDSAGGNLVLATVYSSSENVRSKIRKIVPVYPVTDSRNKDYYSSQNYGKHYYLTSKAMAQFTEGVIRNESDLEDIRLSPLYQVSLEYYPDVFLITAEFDPLRDQGEAYARKKKSEGVNVIAKRYQGTIHSFFGLKDFGTRGVEAIEDIARFINDETISGTLELS